MRLATTHESWSFHKRNEVQRYSSKPMPVVRSRAWRAMTAKKNNSHLRAFHRKSADHSRVGFMGSIASLVLGQFASDACGTTSEKQKIGFLRLIESIKIANLSNHIKRVCPVGHRFVLRPPQEIIAFSSCSLGLTPRRGVACGQVDLAAPGNSHNMILNRIRRDSRRAPMRDRMGWGLPSVFIVSFARAC